MKTRRAAPFCVATLGIALAGACGSNSEPGVSPGSGSGSGGSNDAAAGSTGGSGSSSGAGSSSGTSSSGTSSSGTGSSGTGSSSGGSGSGGGSSDGGGSSSGAADAGSSGGGDDGGLGGSTNSFGTIVGSPAIPRLLALTQNCTAANAISSDPGNFVLDNGMVAHVCSLKGGPGNAGGAVYFTADMDIDCDGLMTTHCPGTGADMDPSWYDQTSFSGPHSGKNAMGQPSLASENTPYVVIPQEVVFPGVDQQNGGNIVAVIYNDQIEFAVFGDQIAAQPGQSGEPIGEASVRTANGLGIPSSPASGGVGGGVTYIVFAGAGSQPADMENIPEIQSLGAQLTVSLLKNNP